MDRLLGNMKYLLDEYPLIVLPSLAVKVGLNESIILQQLHYWVQKSKHIEEGKRWIYNSYPEWQKQFPFWSEKTIKRTITKLENEGFILSGNFNKLSFDRTKWYTIDYEKLDSVPTIGSNCPDEEPNLSRPIPDTTTDKEEEEGNPFRFYEENGFGTLSPFIAEQIDDWMKDFNGSVIVEALKESLNNNVRKWAYADKILKNWSQMNLTTLQQVKAYVEEQKILREKPKTHSTSMLPKQEKKYREVEYVEPPDFIGEEWS